MNTVDHVAAADCERCRPGPIAQPVNAVSSLAFTVAGLVLVARTRRDSPSDAPVDATTAETALGWSAVAAGLGSVAYHGPGTRLGQILHDASLITMLGALVIADTARVTSRTPPRAVFSALPGVATAAAASPWSLPAQVIVGAGAAVAEVARVRRARTGQAPGWRPIAESLVAVGGALGHVFGRTGGPLCRPDSVWQAHAAWHTSMAVTLVLRE